MTDREEQLKRIIRQMLQPLRDIPLDIIIEAITDGCTIWPYDGHARKELERIADLSVAGINAKGIEAGRPNEVGNYCEPFVIEAIRQAGGKAQTPLTGSGRKKSSGYPDIEAEILGKPFYIEVKTYNERNRDTAQRSFYISPSNDFKVTKDAYHLVFAFCMEEVGASGRKRIYKAKSCTVIDAHNLSCDVKYEFNSDNRRLYGTPEIIILRKDYPV